MADLTFDQLEQLWVQAGGSQSMAAVMAAIALAESSGNPDALNASDNHGTQSSFGLWQISTGTHTPPSPQWNIPSVNAQLAVAKFHSQGLGAWGTYTSGAYLRYMNGAAGGAGGDGGSGGAGGASGTSIVQTGLSSWIQGLVGNVGGGFSVMGDTIGDIFGPIANVIINIGTAISDIMKAILWLVNPANWVRIIAAIVGTGALATGLMLMAQAV